MRSRVHGPGSRVHGPRSRVRGTLVAIGFAVSLGVWASGLSARAPEATVMLIFTENGRQDLTATTGTVYFESPGFGSRQRTIRSFRQPVEIDAMPPGSYRLTVVAQSLTSVLVSSRVHELQLDDRSTSIVDVDLVRRIGEIRVVDSTGSAMSGAHFYTSPSSVNSTADDRGTISLATLAVGTEVTVRTIQWGMTCHRVTAAVRQSVVVPDATDELVIVAPTTPTTGLPQRRVMVPSVVLTGATISGLPGSDCAIPYEHFPVTMRRVGGMTEHTMLLPPGAYGIRLSDGRTLSARAPGRVVVQ